MNQSIKKQVQPCLNLEDRIRKFVYQRSQRLVQQIRPQIRSEQPSKKSNKMRQVSLPLKQRKCNHRVINFVKEEKQENLVESIVHSFYSTQIKLCKTQTRRGQFLSKFIKKSKPQNRFTLSVRQWLKKRIVDPNDFTR